MYIAYYSKHEKQCLISADINVKATVERFIDILKHMLMLVLNDFKNDYSYISKLGEKTIQK